MTSTADPAYIQAVSVGFQRSQSSLSTRSDIRIKSALSIAGYELCGENLKRRQEVMSRVSSDDCIHSRRDKAQMMEELIFLYGLHAYNKFNFPRHSSIQLRRARSKIGNAWACENEAFRQMYNHDHIFGDRYAQWACPVKSSLCPHPKTHDQAACRWTDTSEEDQHPPGVILL